MPQRKEEQKLASTNDAIHFLLYLVTLQSISHPSLSEPLTRIHALKVSTLRGISRVSYASIVWGHVGSMKTVDIKRAYRTWNPRGFPREANGPPGFRALLLLWLMTCDPLALNICHLFIMTTCGGGNAIASN